MAVPPKKMERDIYLIFEIMLRFQLKFKGDKLCQSWTHSKKNTKQISQQDITLLHEKHWPFPNEINCRKIIWRWDSGLTSHKKHANLYLHQPTPNRARSIIPKSNYCNPLPSFPSFIHVVAHASSATHTLKWDPLPIRSGAKCSLTEMRCKLLEVIRADILGTADRRMDVCHVAASLAESGSLCAQ